jgi:hypothetical protein
VSADGRSPYRDPLDADESIQTDAAAALDVNKLAADRAQLTREVTILGTDLIHAIDALLTSPLPELLDTAHLLARISEAIEDRRNTAISRLVVSQRVPARQVADRLGWTPARVAFACKTPHQR